MRLIIRVVPRASKNELLGPLPDGSYRARLTAAPVEDAANTSLITLLSKAFNVSKNKITIFRGNHSRKKIIDLFLT